MHVYPQKLNQDVLEAYFAHFVQSNGSNSLAASYAFIEGLTQVNAGLKYYYRVEKNTNCTCGGVILDEIVEELSKIDAFLPLEVGY
eukprot:Pgem_evm1s1747